MQSGRDLIIRAISFLSLFPPWIFSFVAFDTTSLSRNFWWHIVRYRTAFTRKSHENFWDGNWVTRRLIESSEERSSSGQGLIPERDNVAVATSHAILQFRWKLLSSSRAFVLSHHRGLSRISQDGETKFYPLSSSDPFGSWERERERIRIPII